MIRRLRGKRKFQYIIVRNQSEVCQNQNSKKVENLYGIGNSGCKKAYARSLIGLTARNLLFARGVRRGFHGIWIILTGDYPKSQNLKKTSGVALGEWRADGN